MCKVQTEKDIKVGEDKESKAVILSKCVLKIFNAQSGLKVWGAYFIKNAVEINHPITFYVSSFDI